MFVLVFLITASLIAWGQTETEKKKEIQKYREELEKLVTKIFKIKYTDATDLEGVLTPFLTSKGSIFGEIIVNERFNAITIKDYPEKIAVIEEVIKQFDVKPIEVEFTFYLLGASDIPIPVKPVEPVEPVEPEQPVKSAPPVPPLPPPVAKVVEKLQTNFTYKYYRLLDSAFLKSSDSKSSSSHLSLGGSSKYLLDIKWSLLSADSPVINISHFDIIRVGKDGGPLLHTSLLIEDGETAVVGISNSASDDTALVTIIKARILKDKK